MLKNRALHYFGPPSERYNKNWWNTSAKIHGCFFPTSFKATTFKAAVLFGAWHWKCWDLFERYAKNSKKKKNLTSRGAPEEFQGLKDVGNVFVQKVPCFLWWFFRFLSSRLGFEDVFFFDGCLTSKKKTDVIIITAVARPKKNLTSIFFGVHMENRTVTRYRVKISGLGLTTYANVCVTLKIWWVLKLSLFSVPALFVY